MDPTPEALAKTILYASFGVIRANKNAPLTPVQARIIERLANNPTFKRELEILTRRFRTIPSGVRNEFARRLFLIPEGKGYSVTFCEDLIESKHRKIKKLYKIDLNEYYDIKDIKKAFQNFVIMFYNNNKSVKAISVQDLLKKFLGSNIYAKTGEDEKLELIKELKNMKFINFISDKMIEFVRENEKNESKPLSLLGKEGEEISIDKMAMDQIKKKAGFNDKK